MKTITNKLLRTTAVLLAVITVFSMMFSLPVSAVSDEVTIIFDYCYDDSGNIIKFQQKTTNDGYTVGVTGEELCKIFADDEEAYCIEPGHSLFSFDTLKKDATTVWRDLGSAKQKAINLALLYGKPGSGSSLSGNDDEKWVATQLIVWEFVSDCRETKNGFKCTNTKFIDGITAGGANPGVKTVYNEISKSLASYATVPSFASAVLSKAETYELKANGNSYELTLTDENNILSKFDFKTTDGVTVSKSGNKLTLKPSSPLTEEVTFNCAKSMPNVGKAVLIPYGDATQQDIITGVENDNDPVRAYFKVKTSQGSLKIVKTSEDGKVANIGFIVKGDKYNETVKTNSNGEFEIINLIPGTYTVTEIVSDEYEAQKSQTVTVESGKTATVQFDNILKKSEIKIIKKDAETKKTIPLSGFGFKIKKSDGSFVTADKKDVFYTDNTGTITLPIKLTYGKYQLIEASAGTGYVLDSTPVDFEVNGENKTIELVKYNKAQKGTITVTKTGDIFSSVNETNETSTADEATENALKIYQPVYSNGTLSGAEFKITAGEDITTPDGTLQYKKGETVDTVTTGNNGKAVSKQLYLGKYYVTETKAVSGYILNRESYPVTLKYAGQTVEVTNSGVTINNERQKAEITLTKIFEVYEELGIGKNDEIKNVSFALYANEEIKASDGTVIPKDGLIEIVSVSEDGKATFTTDIPFGKFYVQEYKTDEHYVLDDTKYEFEFTCTDENTSVQKIEINNGKAIINKLIIGKLEITKKDVSTGELLPNAGFRIKDESGNIIVEGYTDEKGVAKFTLGYGKYTYEEFDAPDGYIIDTTPYEFEITENGQIIKAEMTNKKQPEPDKPQTGDNSNIGFFIGLGAFAVGGLVSFVIIKFRKKDEDED
ncbi:MAG: SpaA isopeptide-forming pilin-related protein [Ruminococcus sp.]|nr:SpaA isopeptide-forming pilin-related protein [Ruminococcus sp.]